MQERLHRNCIKGAGFYSTCFGSVGIRPGNALFPWRFSLIQRKGQKEKTQSVVYTLPRYLVDNACGFVSGPGMASIPFLSFFPEVNFPDVFCGSRLEFQSIYLTPTFCLLKCCHQTLINQLIFVIL